MNSLLLQVEGLSSSSMVFRNVSSIKQTRLNNELTLDFFYLGLLGGLETSFPNFVYKGFSFFGLAFGVCNSVRGGLTVKLVT